MTNLKKKLLDNTISVEEEIMEQAAKRIADEIDFGVLSGMLCDLGWTKVILSPMTWETGSEVDNWIETNIKGNFETMGLVWVFENQQDANWFTLRWLG